MIGRSRSKKKIRRWLKRRVKASRRAQRRREGLMFRAWMESSDDEATLLKVWSRYCERTGERWYGLALRDARSNFRDFEEIKPQLIDALRSYKANPGQSYTVEKGVTRFLNPDYRLSSFLWKLQKTFSPDGGLAPLIDFEENYQTCFLRRGLIIYCEFLLRGIEAAPPDDPRQLKLALCERAETRGNGLATIASEQSVTAA